MRNDWPPSLFRLDANHATSASRPFNASTWLVEIAYLMASFCPSTQFWNLSFPRQMRMCCPLNPGSIHRLSSHTPFVLPALVYSPASLLTGRPQWRSLCWSLWSLRTYAVLLCVSSGHCWYIKQNLEIQKEGKREIGFCRNFFATKKKEETVWWNFGKEWF